VSKEAELEESVPIPKSLTLGPESIEARIRTLAHVLGSIKVRLGTLMPMHMSMVLDLNNLVSGTKDLVPSIRDPGTDVRVLGLDFSGLGLKH